MLLTTTEQAEAILNECVGKGFSCVELPSYGCDRCFETYEPLLEDFGVDKDNHIEVQHCNVSWIKHRKKGRTRPFVKVACVYCGIEVAIEGAASPFIEVRY